MNPAPTPARGPAAPAENPGTKRDSGQARHFIDRQLIPEYVQSAIRTLHQHKFQAFVVGGSIRDILLGKQPKDFDMATDARPEQIKSIFRRSARLVGRRFLIAHLRYRRRGSHGRGRDDIIEITTFRSTPRTAGGKVQASNGPLLSDNVYGNSVEEDARRRDFSVNALYYDPEQQRVYDFVGGLADLEARCLRVIGDPELRYREDPVRMLRALHFAAKLDFRLDEKNAAALRRLAHGITGARPARLSLEMRKMFPTDYCARTWELLEQYGLFAALFPDTAPLLDSEPRYRRLVRETVKNTQQRCRRGGKDSIFFLYAALLWPALQQQMEYDSAGKDWHFEDLKQHARHILEDQARRIGIPIYLRGRISECWELQLQFVRRQGKGGRAQQLLQRDVFRAGLALLELRAKSGEDLQPLVEWWRQLEAREPAPQASDARGRTSGGRERTRRHRKKLR